jgi:hypothetical protein
MLLRLPSPLQTTSSSTRRHHRRVSREDRHKRPDAQVHKFNSSLHTFAQTRPPSPPPLPPMTTPVSIVSIPFGSSPSLCYITLSPSVLLGPARDHRQPSLPLSHPGTPCNTMRCVLISTRRGYEREERQFSPNCLEKHSTKTRDAPPFLTLAALPLQRPLALQDSTSTGRHCAGTRVDKCTPQR